MIKKTILFIIILLAFSCISIKTRMNVSIEYYNLGNKYLEIKDYAKAINSYNKSLEFNNDSLETIQNLIIAYQLNNNYDDVQKNIIKYFNKGNNDFKKKLLLLLGNNYYLQANYNQAIKTYNEYIESYPNDANCYYNLGLTNLKLNDDDKALANFVEAYKNDNKHIPAIFNIAEYYYKQNDLKNSYYYFKKIEELDKKNAEAYYKLGLIEFINQEYEYARNRLLKAIEINSKNYNYDLLLAQIYAKGYNDKDKTLEYLEKAFKNNFKDLKSIQTNNEFKILNEYDAYKKLLKEYGLKSTTP
jgi:tetratricopeptide (TPR) repeat protein